MASLESPTRIHGHNTTTKETRSRRPITFTVIIAAGVTAADSSDCLSSSSPTVLIRSASLCLSTLPHTECQQLKIYYGIRPGDRPTDQLLPIHIRLDPRLVHDARLLISSSAHAQAIANVHPFRHVQYMYSLLYIKRTFVTKTRVLYAYFYCATQICIARTCYGNVAGWLCHTPVLYQNG